MSSSASLSGGWPQNALVCMDRKRTIDPDLSRHKGINQSALGAVIAPMGQENHDPETFGKPI
ncbi:hypothetical protein GCM10022404_25510 [Celeribacter arenosi]|uniref:Uncharacterized protein n=1 Tax=Celeribacter arenosi TaxID=792649 RepID=A0ABP7KE40_9RHOB